MNKSRLLRKLAGLAFALLLLVPVPALGLTFLGSWNYFIATTGGGGSDVVNGTSTNSTDNPNNYSLTVGMGYVNPPSTITTYTVTATRDFRIDNPSQTINILHFFGSFINDSSIKVTIAIQRFGVANDPFNFPPYNISAPLLNPPGTFVSLNGFGRRGALLQGLYRMTVTLTYTRNPPQGSWNNSSPHTFNFRGL